MRASALACLGLLLTGGCQAEYIPWTDESNFVWHGEQVTVHGYERLEEDACGGSLAAIDAHAASILEFFGETEPVHYDYRWMSHEFWDGRCPPGASACTAWGEPWARDVPHMHENTHGTLYAAWDNSCPSFFTEGLAEYFSRPKPDGTRIPDPSRVTEILTGVPISGPADYNVAAHFTSFVIEEFGPEVIKELCYAIPFDDNTLDDWDKAFEQSTGLGLDEVLAKYEAYPICTQQQYRARLGECEGEPDVIYAGNDKPTVFEVEVDCADKRMLGPINGRAYTTRRLWVPEWTLVHVQIQKKDLPETYSRAFMSQECVPCSASPQVYVMDGLPPIYALNPGMHVITLSVPLDADVPLMVIMNTFDG